jgi:hypothetical protein
MGVFEGFALASRCLLRAQWSDLAAPKSSQRTSNMTTVLRDDCATARS